MGILWDGFVKSALPFEATALVYTRGPPVARVGLTDGLAMAAVFTELISDGCGLVVRDEWAHSPVAWATRADNVTGSCMDGSDRLVPKVCKDREPKDK